MNMYNQYMVNIYVCQGFVGRGTFKNMLPHTKQHVELYEIGDYLDKGNRLFAVL